MADRPYHATNPTSHFKAEKENAEQLMFLYQLTEIYCRKNFKLQRPWNLNTAHVKREGNSDTNN